MVALVTVAYLSVGAAMGIDATGKRQRQCPHEDVNYAIALVIWPVALGAAAIILAFDLEVPVVACRT